LSGMFTSPFICCNKLVRFSVFTANLRGTGEWGGR
jgi:hypothetical protein